MLGRRRAGASILFAATAGDIRFVPMGGLERQKVGGQAGCFGGLRQCLLVEFR